MAAILGASDGETIWLEPGAEYRSENRNVGSLQRRNITVRSADPANPAFLVGCTWGSLAGLTLTELRATELALNECEDIVLRAVDLRGYEDDYGAQDDTPGGPGYYSGSRNLRINSSTGITVQGCRCRNNTQGIEIRGNAARFSVDILIEDSEFSEIQNDSIRGAGIDGIIIRRNLIHRSLGVNPDKLHTDGIHLFTDGGFQCRNVLIEANDILSPGPELRIQQGLILNDAGGVGHVNVTIRDMAVGVNTTEGVNFGGIQGLLVERCVFTPPQFIRAAGNSDVTSRGVIASLFEYPGDVVSEDNVLARGDKTGKPGDAEAVVANWREFRRTGARRHLRSLVPNAGLLTGIDGTWTLHREPFDWRDAGRLVIRRTDTGEIVHQETGLTGDRTVTHQDVRFETTNPDPVLYRGASGVLALNDTELPALEVRAQITIGARDSGQTQFIRRQNICQLRQIDDDLLPEFLGSGSSQARPSLAALGLAPGDVVEVRFVVIDGAAQWYVADQLVHSDQQPALTTAGNGSWLFAGSNVTVEVPQRV